MPPLSPTILTPYGYSSGTCGYCTPSGSRSTAKESSKYGMMAKQMTPQYYQDLMDRGWRRSGTYIYHPDMARTCCPQYTIRLDAQALEPNKKQRQVVNRFNRYLETGAKPGEEGKPVANGKGGQPQGKQDKQGKKGKKGKGRANGGKTDALSGLRDFEVGYGGEEGAAHLFETELVPAEATDERFKLYKSYQVSIHKDQPYEVTKSGFDRFLCAGPLIGTPIEYAAGYEAAGAGAGGRLPEKYGAYHLLYRVDGELIAISVLDILPSGVSSVYFIWHPEWAWASLGKLSALYEADLARRMAVAMGKEKGKVKETGWLYMGYWVPDCQKMRYKSEYAPSELLDPGTNRYHVLTPELEAYLMSHPRGYHPFAQLEASFKVSPPTDTSPSAPKDLSAPEANATGPDAGAGSDSGEDSSDEEPGDWPRPPPPSFADPESFSDAEVDGMLVLLSMKPVRGGKQLFRISELDFVDPRSVRQLVRQFMAAVGKDYIGREGAEGGIAGKGILFLG
ncbi:hypothetical protein IAT38_005374 [Cryptococcus sp. DSM 104549]